MKKLKLKMWVKFILISLAVVLLGTLLLKLDEDYIKGCMNNGYSREYCIKNR